MTYILSAWVKEPTTSWNQVEVDTSKVYDDVTEAIKDFASNGGFKIVSHYPRLHHGNVVMYRLEMKTKYQIEHPETNQAKYEAELTFMEEE